MIDAKDLRIGNFVYPNEENETPYEIHEVGEKEIGFGKDLDYHIIRIPIEELVKIPLSEEVLMSIEGVEKEDDAFVVFKDVDIRLMVSDAHTSPEDGYAIIFCNDSLDEAVYISFVHSLHELQNVIYSLFKKELEFKK